MKQTTSPSFRDRRTMVRQDERFIRLPQVLEICGMSRSFLYESIKNGKFPAPIKLQGRSSAWIRSEVRYWMAVCIEHSRQVDDRVRP